MTQGARLLFIFSLVAIISGCKTDSDTENTPTVDPILTLGLIDITDAKALVIVSSEGTYTLKKIIGDGSLKDVGFFDTNGDAYNGFTVTENVFNVNDQFVALTVCKAENSWAYLVNKKTGKLVSFDGFPNEAPELHGKQFTFQNDDDGNFYYKNGNTGRLVKMSSDGSTATPISLQNSGTITFFRVDQSGNICYRADSGGLEEYRIIGANGSLIETYATYIVDGITHIPGFVFVSADDGAFYISYHSSNDQSEIIQVLVNSDGTVSSKRYALITDEQFAQEGMWFSIYTSSSVSLELVTKGASSGLFYFDDGYLTRVYDSSVASGFSAVYLIDSTRAECTSFVSAASLGRIMYFFGMNGTSSRVFSIDSETYEKKNVFSNSKYKITNGYVMSGDDIYLTGTRASDGSMVFGKIASNDLNIIESGTEVTDFLVVE